jgi:hypothetical protein
MHMWQVAVEATVVAAASMAVAAMVAAVVAMAHVGALTEVVAVMVAAVSRQGDYVMAHKKGQQQQRLWVAHELTRADNVKVWCKQPPCNWVCRQ